MANRLCFLVISVSMLLFSLIDSRAVGTPARLNYKEIYSEFEYPKAALNNQIDAIAFVEVNIDENGFAESVYVMKSDLLCYKKPIRSAVRKAKHTAATENGKPIMKKVIDTLYFPFPSDSVSSQEERRRRYFELHSIDLFLKSDSAMKSKIDKLIDLDTAPEFDFEELSKRIIYPDSMQKKGIEGMVRMRLYIDSNGIVKKSYPYRFPHPDLSLAAEEAILSIKFKPAMYQGKPIAIWFEIPIEFNLVKELK